MGTKNNGPKVFALRLLSDWLCLENGLSIVENPKPRSQSM